MKVEQGKVYSCGKPMLRKIISINGDRVKYSKCHCTHKGFYVIGNETHFLHDVGLSYFQSWAKSEIDVAGNAFNRLNKPSVAAAVGKYF